MAILDLRPNCECCDVDLVLGADTAMICTFECTFCTVCAAGFDTTCPNCLGNLVERPKRPAGGPTGGLSKYQPQGERVVSNQACTHR